MRKAELRKLRRLDATKEMMSKAAADETVEAKYWWEKKTYTHAAYIRAQHLGNYLKVTVFATEWMKKGISTPCHEIFIDVDAQCWENRCLDEAGSETGWTKAMINNLSLPRKDGSWLAYLGEGDVWMDAHQAANVKKTLKTNASGYHAIREWQSKARAEEIRERRRKECEPWDKDMELIPELPKDFKSWITHTAVNEQYIFYEYVRGGAKTGWCSACLHEVKIKDTPHHNAHGRCTRCHKEITYKAAGRIKTLAQCVTDAQIMQNIVGGIVVRYFNAEVYYGDDYKKPDVRIYETCRTLISDSYTRYRYELYKNTEMRWCEESMTSYWQGRGPVYKTNINRIRCEKVTKSGLINLVKNNEPTDCAFWLYNIINMPVAEKCAKAGAYKLAAYMIVHNGSISSRETELTKALRIDRMRLHRLVEANGGNIYLKYLQAEKAADTIWPDDIIKAFEAAGVYYSELSSLRSHMSLVAVYNFLEKNRGTDTLRQTVRTYNDYCNMAVKAKLDMSAEQNYKPKNLKAAHQKVVDMLNAEGYRKIAMKAAKKWPKVNAECKKLKKYEYSGDKYMIVAPCGITDIVREGSVLGHCIHTCDFYYDRIQQRESFIMFLRKKETPDTPWYTLEIEPGGNIRQKRTVGDNQNADLKAAVPFLHDWQRWLQRTLSDEDRKLAAVSDRKRRESYRKIREENKRVWHGKLAGKSLADVLEADFLGLDEEMEKLNETRAEDTADILFGDNEQKEAI